MEIFWSDDVTYSTLNNWLEYLDKGFKITNRHIAMIIDNAASHNLAISAEDTESESESEKEFSSNVASSSTSIINYNNKRKKTDNQKKNPGNNKLTNITLVYLPPNTTAHLQPMDAGIIQNFKVIKK